MRTTLRLAIVFGIIYFVTLILFLPMRYVLRWVDVPSPLTIEVQSGSVWKGAGHITIEALETRIGLDLTWRACLSRSFPFYSNCVTLANRDLKLSGKLVGFPAENLLIQALNGRIELAGMAGLIKEAVPLIVFANPQGEARFEIADFRYSLVDNRPLAWKGNIEILSLVIFGVSLPAIVAQLHQAPFASQNAREVLFANQDLPSFRFTGGNEKLGVQGEGQFLPDNQVKVAVESTVLDNSLRPALEVIASRRQGNKYFWEYQGDYSLSKNTLTD